jgi:hypothetical protein
VTEGTRTPDLQGHNLSHGTRDESGWATYTQADLDGGRASGRDRRLVVDLTVDGVGVS